MTIKHTAPLSVFTALLALFFLFSCSPSSPEWKAEEEYDARNFIILMHGLGGVPETFASMKRELERRRPEVPVLLLKETRTYDLSIGQQAEDAYRQLVTKHRVRCQDRVILVAHSLAGLTAYQLSQAFGGRRLNVKGVVAIGTPWEGAPMIANKSKVEKLLRRLERVPGFPKQLKRSVQAFYDRIQLKGPSIDDMKPGSAFVEKVRQGLKENKIPILAIAGDQGNLFSSALNSVASSGTKNSHKEGTFSFSEAIVHLAIQGIEHRLEEKVIEIVGGTPHDFALPVGVQLAAGIGKKKNFAPLTVMDVAHVPVPGIVPLENAQLGHPEIIEAVVKFASAQLGVSPIPAS